MRSRVSISEISISESRVLVKSRTLVSLSEVSYISEVSHGEASSRRGLPRSMPGPRRPARISEVSGLGIVAGPRDLRE